MNRNTSTSCYPPSSVISGSVSRNHRLDSLELVGYTFSHFLGKKLAIRNLVEIVQWRIQDVGNGGGGAPIQVKHMVKHVVGV